MKVDSVSNLALSQDISQKNSVGNSRLSRSGQTAKVSSVDTTHSGTGAYPVLSTSASSVGNSSEIHNGLSSAERAFFAKLFPDASSRINAHSTTYSPGGVQSPVELGQIINRKV